MLRLLLVLLVGVFLHFTMGCEVFESRPKIFLLLGNGGTGKSAFCNTLKGESVAAVRSMYNAPATFNCQLVSVFHEKLFNGVPVLLIDTPSLAPEDQLTMNYITQYVDDFLADSHREAVDGIILFQSVMDSKNRLKENLKAIEQMFPERTPPITLMITMTVISISSQAVVDAIHGEATSRGITSMVWDNYDHLAFSLENGFKAVPLTKDKLEAQLSDLNTLLTQL